MKPIKLTITAFGPYADAQVIDFRELGDRSLFLIHGATGAGKTTILDAICFALYGETSGNERKSEHMRSHHTKSKITTTVMFDFALGGDVYRVMRSLKRERAKGAEEEVIYKSDKAMLWNRTGIESDQNAGIALASKWREVTQEIETLLGFESMQFRQVIMLPQDKFQQLLKADSRDRENLFKMLFQTEQFERIEIALKEQAKNLHDELKALVQKQELILQIVHVDAPAELAHKRQEASDEQQAIHKKLASLRILALQAADQLEQGKNVYSKIDEYERAEDHLRQLELRKAEFAEKQNLLERARRASQLIELENNLLQQESDADAAETKRKNAQADYEKAIEVQRFTAKALARESQSQSEREEARRERDRLQSLYGQVQELDEAQQKLKARQVTTVQAMGKRDVTKDQLDDLQIQLMQLKQSLLHADILALQFTSAQQAETDARQVYDKWMQLHSITQQWERAKEQEVDSQQALKQIEDRLIKAREHCDKLETAWHEGQAAILALQLVDDTPCPVCGSTHHPKPASPTQISPSESELKSARSTVKSVETEFGKARDEWTNYREEVVRLDTERKPFVIALGEKVRLPFGEIETEFQAAQLALQEARREIERIETIKKQVGPLETQIAEADALFTKAERAYQDALNERTAAQAVLDERKRNVPLEFNDLQKLKMAKQATDAKIKQLEKALQEAQIADDQAKQDLASCEATLKQLSEQATVEKQQAEDQKSLFSTRITGGEFVDVNDYHNAKLMPQAIANLEREIRAHDSGLQAANEHLERARQATGSLVKPDIAKLQAEDQQAKDDVESAVREEADLQSKLNGYDQSQAQLDEIQNEFLHKDREYAVVGKIAEVAAGKNAYQISFHRFVLSTLLDYVLDDATQRLQTMSRGRYILQRAQSPLGRSRSSGLDLVVSDTHTGDSRRPVQTLSGGESFYTSLALALGLAEIVQSFAGGIRLDTIFIDEGFGSLDSDTLDLAIRTLENLKEDGRLVGIISHVDSLRERISVRLEVTTGVNGSTAKFKRG